MSPDIRGPSGIASPPPDWLKTVTLPMMVVPAEQPLHRIHRVDLDPIFFGPGAGKAATYRFDSATGRFGVLYAGNGLNGALAETILRNPRRLMVAETEIVSRAATELICDRDLHFVDMHGAGLQALGTDNAISTGPYEPCGLWADALWDHPDQPDGIAYLSRHDPGEICFAIFERLPMEFTARATRPLEVMLKQVASMLDRYGKSIAPST